MTRRLCVFDVDSTLLTSGVIELLAERSGMRDEVASIAEAAARGEIGETEALERGVATLKGFPVTLCDDVLASLRFTPGAENLVATLHANSWVVALVSAGFNEVVGPLAARLGISLYRANGLESIDGYLTGRTLGPVVDSAAKEAALREFAEVEGIPIHNTVAVGALVSDLDMMRAAGVGVAFNSKPIVQDQSDTAVTSTRLDAILAILDA